MKNPFSFFGAKTRKIKELEDYIEKLKQSMPSEASTLADLKIQIEKEEKELAHIQNAIKIDQEELDRVRKTIIEVKDEALLQSFGLYEPQYSFANSDLYKERLLKLREHQKSMIKTGIAVTGNTEWTVNGSKAKGKKMVKDMQKLLLRAFNGECDELIAKVKFNNIETAEKRITSSKEAISKLGTIMSVSISELYYQSKIQELYLAYEYQLKKQEEKEEQQRIREELREAAKLEKEIAEARKNIYKEQQHYQNALSKLQKQMAETDDTDKQFALKEKEAEILSQLDKLDENLKKVDYREANQKAGYVYIISNIGAFGENVYKIGMTRRLDPYERVDELGDASVPFKFDVHAMIFSENAPQLEATLHRAFDKKKVNMINTRREFFNVSLEEIEQVIKANYDKTVDFVRYAPAEQYRQSLLMKQEKQPA